MQGSQILFRLTVLPLSAAIYKLVLLPTGNLLKPMLGRGELRCIGATTLDEFRKYIGEALLCPCNCAHLMHLPVSEPVDDDRSADGRAAFNQSLLSPPC